MKQFFTIILCLIVVISTQAQHQYWYNIVPDTHKANDIHANGNDIYISNSAGYIVLDKTTGNMSYKDINNSKLFRTGVGEVTVNDADKMWMINDMFLASIEGSSAMFYPYFYFFNAHELTQNDQGDFYFISDAGLIKYIFPNYEVYNDTNSIFEIPSSSPTSLDLDINGDLWIAQYNKGLYHFDGTNFTLYDMNNSSIPALDLRSITVLDNGTVYMGSASLGLIEFDGANWTTYNTQNSNLTWDAVLELESHATTVYGIATDGFQNEVFEFEAGVLNMVNSSNSPLPQAKFEHLTMDDDGEIWFEAIENGEHAILRYDGTNINTYELSKSILETPMIEDIEKGGNGKVSFTNYNENYSTIHLIENQNNQFTTFPTNSGDANQIISYNTSTLIYGGIDLVHVFSNGNFTPYSSANTNVNSLSVTTACIDEFGDLWLATDLALVKYDGTDFTEEHSFAGTLLDNYTVLDLEVDSSGTFWMIASSTGNLSDAQLVSFNGIDYDFYQDNMGSNMNFNFLSKSPSDVIYTFGINNKTIYKTTTSGISSQQSYSGSLANGEVTAFDMSTGYPIIGSNNYGVIYNSASGYDLFLTNTVPILSNNVTSLEVDDQNNVWIATVKGISVFNENGISLNTEDVVLENNADIAQIYPNPSKGVLHIGLDEKALNSELLIYNVQGKLVKSMVLNQLSETINISEEKSGIYFYSLKKNNEVLKSGKLVKL